ncbi:MAG TPA: MBL fold metallo-hydrolase [Clostridia bacterium]|nr:MBL fold metallo-hydrolase [Clostridia bacterium]
MKKNVRARKIATFIIMTIMFSVFILDIITVVLCNKYENRYPITAEVFASGNGADRLHFLSTGNSDALIIESNGHFALIDSGEGSNNPRVSARIDGYEDLIVDYLKKIAADENGKVYLDFVLGTHYHYDHVGGFEEILENEDIIIGTAYFKEFYKECAKPNECSILGLDILYETIVELLEKRDFEWVSDLPKEPFSFGDFTIQFFNTEQDTSQINVGENDNSVGVKLVKDSFSAFLAADITNVKGLEKKLAPQIGEVDLLKIGHHGYALASSRGFIKTLNPKMAIVTNGLGKIYPNVKWSLTMHTHTSTYSTVKENGVIATISDSGDITLTNNIH